MRKRGESLVLDDIIQSTLKPTGLGLHIPDIRLWIWHTGENQSPETFCFLLKG